MGDRAFIVYKNMLLAINNVITNNIFKNHYFSFSSSIKRWRKASS